MFPEYPLKSLENNQEFYLNENAEIEATRCSLNITGQIKNPSSLTGKCESFSSDGLPSIDCTFEEDLPNHNEDVRIGSLLYRPYAAHVIILFENHIIFNFSKLFKVLLVKM